MPADIHQVGSGGFYIFQKVTELLGRKLRKDVTYRSVPLDDARSSMIANGISASFTEALIETPASFNRQEPRAKSDGHSTRQLQKTQLERPSNNGLLNRSQLRSLHDSRE
ncbi:hypothetical protein ACVWZL_003652 [Bradyrhizobium sp. GM2.4]